MKTTALSCFILWALLLCYPSCKKDVPPQLPPETQTGAGTFGFTANGKIFKAKYYNRPDAIATYIYMNFPYPSGSGYFLTVSASSNNPLWFCGVLSDSLKVEEGIPYSLKNSIYIPATCGGIYRYEGKDYKTNSHTNGELKITHLDSVKQIISGTFWFDAVDTISNSTVQIRNGRFDMPYTQ